MVTIEQLYKDYGVLADAKDKAGEHVETYKSILSAVEASGGEKRLAAQFIPRFFKYFPTLAEQAINAQLDLCEDDDSSIRRQAIKELPNLCKENKDHLVRIADVLTQLLQSEDAQDLSTVNGALIALLKIDAKGTLGGLFEQILKGEDTVRERAIKFLSTKLKNLSAELITKDVEELMIDKSKEVLQDVNGEEFITFMTILSKLESMQTLTGRQQMVELVAEQADFKADFEHSDGDCVDRLLQCVQQALPFFSRNVPSTKFVLYICDHVLPVLDKVVSPGEETEASSAGDGKAPAKVDIKLDIVKLLAEMSQFTGDFTADNETALSNLYTTLLAYMPLPPAESENADEEKSNGSPKLQFSHVECLMFAFHQVAKRKPGFLTDEENAEKLKDFRLRLQYFARGTQLYMKQLRLALQGKSGADLKSDENKLKLVALRVTTNINVLIKDLFHNPPSYKSTVMLSWKPAQRSSSESGTQPQQTQKRSNITPITFSDGSPPSKKPQQGNKGGNKNRGQRTMYTPPGGKYSNKAGAAPTFGDADYGSGFGGRGGQNQYRRRGRGRGRGGWRY
ncbi:apoptosis inhibitor 5-like [Amphiura filiformis]|uniref:apoptosis inhibitor 5-like n=1 Tax=Amphiura filiformis TaxID=82378 RepID=UPI003B21E9F9